jgi:hypothetical protein
VMVRRIPGLLVSSGLLLILSLLFTLPVLIDRVLGQTKSAGAIGVMVFFPFFSLFFLSGLVCLLIWAVRAAYFARARRLSGSCK